MFYLEDNWELNEESKSVVHYVLHYKRTQNPYDDDYMYTEDGDYVKVLFMNNKYTLQNKPKDFKVEVDNYLKELNKNNL